MTHLRCQFLLPVALLLAAACANNSSALQQRYDSASQIDSAPARDTQMREIAIDSANAGNSSWCLSSLSEIQNPTLRDQTSQLCAVKFSALGRKDVCAEIIDGIGNPTVQANLRKQLGIAAPTI